MSLLGYFYGKPRERHILYPEFTANTEIIFCNWIQIIFEFGLWVFYFKETHVENYKQEEDEIPFIKLMELYEKSQIRGKYKHRVAN